MEKLPFLVHICYGESAGRVRSSHQFLKLDISRTLNFLRVFEPLDTVNNVNISSIYISKQIVLAEYICKNI